jgi:hypothetical protein
MCVAEILTPYLLQREHSTPESQVLTHTETNFCRIRKQHRSDFDHGVSARTKWNLEESRLYEKRGVGVGVGLGVGVGVGGRQSVTCAVG